MKNLKANADAMQHYIDRAEARLGGVEYHGDKTLEHMSATAGDTMKEYKGLNWPTGFVRHGNTVNFVGNDDPDPYFDHAGQEAISWLERVKGVSHIRTVKGGSGTTRVQFSFGGELWDVKFDNDDGVGEIIKPK